MVPVNQLLRILNKLKSKAPSLDHSGYLMLCFILLWFQLLGWKTTRCKKRWYTKNFKGLFYRNASLFVTVCKSHFSSIFIPLHVFVNNFSKQTNLLSNISLKKDIWRMRWEQILLVTSIKEIGPTEAHSQKSKPLFRCFSTKIQVTSTGVFNLLQRIKCWHGTQPRHQILVKCHRFTNYRRLLAYMG